MEGRKSEREMGEGEKEKIPLLAFSNQRGIWKLVCTTFFVPGPLPADKRQELAKKFWKTLFQRYRSFRLHLELFSFYVKMYTYNFLECAPHRVVKCSFDSCTVEKTSWISNYDRCIETLLWYVKKIQVLTTQSWKKKRNGDGSTMNYCTTILLLYLLSVDHQARWNCYIISGI